MLWIVIDYVYESAARTLSALRRTNSFSPPRLRLLSGAPSFEFETPDAALTPRQGEPYRCSGLRHAMLTSRGFGCGPPLGQPCFDFERCTTSPGIYVHDGTCCECKAAAALRAHRYTSCFAGRLSHVEPTACKKLINPLVVHIREVPCF